MTELQGFKAKTAKNARDIIHSGSLRFAFFRLMNILNWALSKLGLGLPLATLSRQNISGSESHLLRYMRFDGGCFVDVGAASGYWTTRIARRGVFVYAVEPHPVSARLLMDLTRDYDNVAVLPVALGGSNHRSTLNLHVKPSHSSLVKQGADYLHVRVPVRVRTLDSLGIENIDLIKIDTEGYEVNVLRGARETIRRQHPVLIIEVHNPYRVEQRRICRVLRRLGYAWKVEYKRYPYRNPEPQPHIIAWHQEATT